ncbi:MAG: D-alanyl-D-alanine carboxypeptidase, partial [Acholeplasmatales bacterium]|nr:D-alanyl-D-alanine carboxypeptidase [Acholeplasmatales bacterium]
MKKILVIILLPIFLLFTVSMAPSNTDSAYIVLEASTLRILDGNNIDKQLLVASTGKILTAITVIENYDLNEVITISNADENAVGSSIYLKENEKITRRDLLYALMLRSANDAASALSNNNSDEFIELMNETAKKIGMKNSIFTNASGLDEKEYNLSTAYDMALLSAYAAKNETFKAISSSHTHTCSTDIRRYTFINKHKLVNKEDEFLWGKTGYTKKAHRILVSNYVKDDMDIIIVTINNSDDWSFHKEAVNSLNEYEFIKIYDKGLYEIKLDKQYYLAIDSDIVIPILNEELNNTSIKFRIYKDKAILDVYINNELIYSKNVKVYDKKNINIDM